MAAIPLRRLVAAALACSLLTAAACGDGSSDDTGRADESSDADGPAGQTVKADLARVSPPADAPVDQVVTGLRDFALRLAASEDPGENVVLSPTSIGVAFAMAEAGASDATAADIAEVFGFPDQPAVHEAMNALTAQLDATNHPGNEDSEGVTLELANALWGQEGLEFGPEFLDTLATQYGAGVDTVDFAGDPEGAKAAINGWVSDVTRERIPDLISEIDPATVVAIVNAIYLKASWQTQFAEDLTSDGPFTLTSGSTVDVPTMHASSLNTSAAEGDGWQAVRLPYDGNELSMVVVVPDEGTSLADFESGLDGAGLGQILDGLESASVDLSLPRFEASSALDLAEPLSALGLTIPGGDLGRVAPGTSVAIGQAVHAANITVDEKGTEAAAATLIMGVTSMPSEILTIDVDRPFLFVVQHDETGAPLFYGRITDPRG
ncbi:MAG TPA: serpin family protein [Acidimicrobiales bacterium]|nr:serpin family protein [Acidimicrobiales bacterium]